MISGLAEPPAHFEPVHPGHGDVQDDGVGGSFGVGAEGGGAVVGHLGLVSLESQGPIEGLPHRWFVVDH